MKMDKLGEITFVTITESEPVTTPGDYKHHVFSTHEFMVAYPSGRPHSFHASLSQALSIIGHCLGTDNFDTFTFKGMFLYERKGKTDFWNRIKEIKISWENTKQPVGWK